MLTIFRKLTIFNRLTLFKNFSIFNRLTIFKTLAARTLTPTIQHLALLFSLGCLLYFSGNASLAVTDPVESNYTETAAEMLASGNYLSPLIYGNYWYDKPILFYWELLAAFKIFGIQEFSARFFPALSGIAGLFLTYGFASRIYDRKTGLTAAVILGTSLEYWLLSKTIITDGALFLFFNASLICFYLAYTTGQKNYYYGCYLSSALAVLTKGPIGLLLPGLIILVFLAWQHDLARLKQMKLAIGSLLFILLGGSWYYLMYLQHGQAFLDVFFGVHNFLRATVSEHPRWDVWYYYLGIFFIGFFPWCFTLPLALHKYYQLRQWPQLEATTRFLWLWALIVNLFFQAMATKYTTYTFPALLPLSILAARLLLTRTHSIKTLAGMALVLYTTLTFLIAIPLCQDRYSAKPLAAALAQQLQAEDLLVQYGDYKTSLVFYTRHLVYKLESEAAIEADKPKAMSWSSKNVMPFLAFEDLPEDKNIYLILDERKITSFPKELQPDEWILWQKTPAGSIYYRPRSRR